ncbi:MAG: SH3 domain-containing protein [Devosia sp.]
MGSPVRHFHLSLWGRGGAQRRVRGPGTQQPLKAPHPAQEGRPLPQRERWDAAPERLSPPPARLPAAATTPAGGAAPQFEARLLVTANSLNLRESPSTAGRVLGSLTRNSLVRVGERRGGWVNVSVDGVVGWVSADYLGAEPVVAAAPREVQRPATVYSAPRQNQSRQPVAQRGNDASCPRRQYCTRIGTCAEARWYLANCSWGALLDGIAMACRARRYAGEGQ